MGTYSCPALRLTRAAGANTELLFDASDSKTRGIAFDDERRNAPVALTRINGGKNDVAIGFTPVADPELSPIQHVMITVERGPRLQGKRITA